MDVCVFCGRAVVPGPGDGELSWLDETGVAECDADGWAGPHYPGKESELFWQGSVVVDLTGGRPTVERPATRPET